MRLSEEDPYFESEGYLDTREFKAYANQVRGVIAAHEAPVSIRTIHLVLGEDAKPSWTADALEAIRGIEAIGVMPTRYRIANARPVQPPTPFGRVQA